MRRAVVFLGGSREFAAPFQHAVAGSAAALRRSGILLPQTGRRSNAGIGLTHQRLPAMGRAGFSDLSGECSESSAEVLLLVLPSLLRVGAGGEGDAGAFVEQLATLAESVVTVSVVGDQLTLINDFYVNQVASWRMSGRLESVAPRMFKQGQFAHERSLRPWYEQPATRYVAIPAPSYQAGNPVEVVLEAAGIEAADSFAEPPPGTPRPGPVAVEASRLLATYLRAEIPDFEPDRPAVVAARRSSLARLDALGWCTGRFWGWTPRVRDRAIARFEATNDRFAQRVWGTDWPMPYPVDRPCNQLDVLDLDPQRIDQVQHYVTSTARRVAGQLEEVG